MAFTNKIIFSTYCHDEYQERFGFHKLISSFRYFHPDYQIVGYGSEDINRIYKENNVNLSNALPCLMLDIKRKYGAEYVCHIDADSLVLGRLDEILEFDYEIASCKNNCDTHTGDERQNRPQQLWGLPNDKYVSCGCLCTNSENFLEKWKDLNDQIIENFGGVKSFWMCDQNMMNILFHYGGYNSKILDSSDKNCYYGASLPVPKNPENIEDPPHIIKEYGINEWKSWKLINYNEENGNFYYGDKTVKLVHQQGGGNPSTVIKCHLSMFNDKTRAKLQEITGYQE